MTATENRVTFGLKDLVIFFDGDVADESIEHPGIYIDSVIDYSRSMNTNDNDLYANDRLYYRLRDEKNGDGTLETANLPKSVLARMLGWRIDPNGGLVHMKDAKPERFSMCFSVSGDQYERRKFIYGCEAAMSDDNNSTRGENVTFRTEQAAITEFGIDRDGEHVWDYTIYKAEDAEGFAASMQDMVYPQAAESDDVSGAAIPGA